MKSFFIILFLSSSFLSTEAQITQIDNNHGLDGVYGNFPVDLGNKKIMQSSVDSSLWTLDEIGASAYQYCSKAKFDFYSAIDTANARLFFEGTTDTSGTELWMTDGTNEGTKMVKDINPGVGSSNVNILASMNGKIYFTANSPEYGNELWTTDGTDEGTKMVKDINPGTNGIYVGYAQVIMNDVLYLNMDDGTHGSELWRTDGTSDGTWLVVDINDDPNVYNGDAICTNESEKFASIGNAFVFTAYSNYYGYSLWRTDGISGNTEIVAVLNDPSTYDIYAGSSFFKASNDSLFFTDNTRKQLWLTNGYKTNTGLVKDFGDESGSGTQILLESSMVLNNSFTYCVMNGMSGYSALWKTNLNDLSTNYFFLDQTFQPRISYFLQPYKFYLGEWLHPLSDYLNIAPLNGNVFIRGLSKDGKTTRLYITDGTNVTTLKDFRYLTYQPNYYRYFNDKFYFVADDGIHGKEIWSSDGTIPGTTLFDDINPGSSGSNPVFDFEFNGTEYFSADNGDNSNNYSDLFKIDIALPITLVNFTGNIKNNNAILSWQTANETSLNNFIIQRSNDGINFNEITSIKAKNSDLKETYTYTDINALGTSSKQYYRLKMNNKNGDFYFSKIIELFATENDIQIKAFPTPVKDILTITYNNNSNSKATMVITDIAGKILFIKKDIAENSSGQETVDVGNFGNGIYYLLLQNKNQKKLTSFIKR